jgi:hypothetical protein
LFDNLNNFKLVVPSISFDSGAGVLTIGIISAIASTAEQPSLSLLF